MTFALAHWTKITNFTVREKNETAVKLQVEMMPVWLKSRVTWSKTGLEGEIFFLFICELSKLF